MNLFIKVQLYLFVSSRFNFNLFMQIKNPKISVIMPVYNASEYLPEAIESILNQTYSNFEFIILNDNSTDNSLTIIEKYHVIDKRIQLINKTKNVGPATLRNEGIDVAKGEYIALMDADDISELTRFEKQIAVFNNNCDIDLCATNYTKFCENKNEEYVKHFENHPEIKYNFLFGCYIANPTIMMKKKILDGYRYNSSFFPVDDYELLSRLILNFTFYNIQESLLKYRWHENNISQTKKVNIDNLTDRIKLNQWKKIDENLNPIYLELSLNFKERQSPEDVIEILKTQKILLENNYKKQIYDNEIFSNPIQIAQYKTIKKVKKYNLKLLKYLIKNGYLKNQKFVNMVKILFKSCFNF